ncbi:unnamed protein product [Phytophthora fragariaefolia]|uniref:Unnamed protein product n=1 Tax=Phytophthora fragariaefolia TaxID=1490495 RepID=A0A9W6U8B6_9STRA|nr:unnamed protein product [Phytophthora fragariaefolia]
MKSVLIGMALLTGGGPESSDASPQSAPDANSSMEAMMLCLGLAENAFAGVDKSSAVLGFEDFIAWARSNREFMLQVERFRLIAEKAVGFEDALSLPAGSDDDSDLDAEDFRVPNKTQDVNLPDQCGNIRKRAEIPPPWMIEPTPLHVPNNGISACRKHGMPPPANLELEWVYGTSGPSVRNACRLVATGEAVYFVGSYVVLYSFKEHGQRYYCAHKRAIGCLDVNATGEIVATGDACASNTPTHKGAAEIHIWNARTLQCLAVLRNFHPSGIAHISFPAVASAATATLQQTQVFSLGERNGAGGNSSSVLSSNLMKKKPQEAEALVASVGSDHTASMALWNWQKEAVVASGRAHPTATGRRTRASGGSKRQTLALALNEDGDEIVVVGAHFVVFHQVAGRFFKHKKPLWHGTVDPPLRTVPVCLSAVYYGIQTAVVGTARGELLLFERHAVTRCVQAHDTQTSVNVCLLSCQSMVLFSAGKDGQIKQWDSTLHPIGLPLDLHALVHVPMVKPSASPSSRPESSLEGDDFRICSLDYDAPRKRFLVATRAGNIFEVDEVPDSSAGSSSANSDFKWRIVASGHAGQSTRSIATARTVGGCFASCGIGERSVKLWSLRRRAFVQHLRFPGSSAPPSALEFSNDGERLAVGGEDGTIMLVRRAGSASTGMMTIETTMKNTSSAVVAMRFGPTDPLLAVARDNGFIYLYRLELGRRRFSRHMLLKPQAGDGNAENSYEVTPAHALDFSIDGSFLRTQHGNSSLYFWDLRQRAGTRITSVATLRDVQWHTHSTSISWSVGGLSFSPRDMDTGVCVDANATRGLTLLLNSDGDINLTAFPCPPSSSAAEDSSQNCWLSRTVPQAHLTKPVSLAHSSTCQPPMCGSFALRGNLVVTGSQYDPAICQWRVLKELSDVQPRPECLYDQGLRTRLHTLGLKDVYFDYGRLDDDEEDDQPVNGSQRILPKRAGGNVSQAVVVRGVPEVSSQRSEASDLALTLSYVYGLNHRSMSVNQSLACLGNGSYVYGAGSLLVLRHLHAFGTRQRIVTPGLQHSVSCLVKHPSEPVLAVGSRRDDQVVLLRTEKSPASSGEMFQQVGILKASVIPNASKTEKKTLITVAFCDSNDNSTRTIQSDLAAVIWKHSHSHVHTLVFYSWKRQLTLAYMPMTRLPVLFGKFAGASNTGAHFVSGGVDHVAFWHLNPATGHVTTQQGVFGRHALVQTMLCCAYVDPFVLTGGENGSIVLWESGVAAFTMHASSSARHSTAGDGVVALEHLQSSQVVLGALRNGSLVVWKYTSARSPTRELKYSRSRVQANTFLQHIQVIMMYDPGMPISSKTIPPMASPLSDDVHIQGMNLLDDAAVAAVVLSNGEVLSVDTESIIEASAEPSQASTTIKTEAGEKARTLLNFSNAINDIALHPRDLRWASASADGHIYVWNLNTNLQSQKQTMPNVPCSLAWSATGDHLAVSLLNGCVTILNGTTLELLLQFTCGDAENTSNEHTIFPKWCNVVKYSPLCSQPGSSASRNWLALACRDFNIYVYSWDSAGADTSPPVYTLQHTFVGHTAPIEALDFSLDGEWLQSATSSIDRQLMRWSLLKEPLSSENNTPKRDGWDLLDDAWASWTATFAGPVEGLAECCGVGKTTTLARINCEAISDKGSNSASTVKYWSSTLPVAAVGLDNGHMILVWYPLTRGDVTTPAFIAESERFSDPAAVTKEYVGCFSRGSLIRRVGFSFANAFVVALARNASGSTQILIWKTDYDDELRLRQRFALKSTVSLEPDPYWYRCPVDRTLFEECIRLSRTNEPARRAIQQGDEGVGESELDSPETDEELYLEFIYGFNPGATGSRNVFYADDAWEIVYAAGSSGVVYNTKMQTQLLNYRTEPDRHTTISALAVHPKGDLVASGECLVTTSLATRSRRPPEIIIWDANSGSTIIRIATKQRPGVLLLEFSPDGHRLASVSMGLDHTLAIYAISGGEREGGRLRTTLIANCKTSTRRVWGLSFGEDGELVTCGDQHILFWQQSAVSSGRSGDDENRFTGLKSGLLTSHKECDPHATLLQVAHLTSRARMVVSSQADGSLYLWKDRICVSVRRNAHGDAPIPALAVDRKQSLLFSAGEDSRICAWNVQLELVRVVANIAELNAGSLGLIPLTSTKIQSLAVRDGHFLFTTAGSEVCELVETRSQGFMEKDWRLHVYIRGHANGQLCGLAVHPCKCAQFASAGDDGVVRLWDAATRSLLAFHRWESASEFPTRGSDELRALAFSADGKHLTVGTIDGTVRVLSAGLDSVVTQWCCWQDQQHGHAVLSLQYSLDGKFLAVGCQDGTVHMYNAASYRKITILRASISSTNTIGLAFARDRPVLRVQCNGAGKQEVWFWELGTWKALPIVQVRDIHCESKRHPSLVHGTTRCDDSNVAEAAFEGHATPVTSWAVTKNEHFLLSTGGADRVVCQFRLPPRSAVMHK